MRQNVSQGGRDHPKGCSDMDSSRQVMNLDDQDDLKLRDSSTCSRIVNDGGSSRE